MNRVCVIRGGIVHNIIVLDLADLPTYIYPGTYDLMVPDEDENRAIGDTYNAGTGTFSKP
jgi:hypothetical protein